MKKAFTIFLILIGLTIAFFVGKGFIEKQKEKNYYKDVTKGWYVEILIDKLKVREHDTANSKQLGEVHKGEVYKVLDFSEGDGNHYWYKIEFYDTGKTGWVANNTKGTYLVDHNDPNDVAIPIIQYKENTYHVVSYEKINTDGLTAWDDRDDYVITWTVYYEPKNAQGNPDWWIQWRIEDKSGKYSTKLQHIKFEKEPKEGQYKLFDECVRDNGEHC